MRGKSGFTLLEMIVATTIMGIAVAGLMSLAASGLVLVSQRPWVIGASQIIACIAGAALGPGMVGLTLGVARQAGFNAGLLATTGFVMVGRTIKFEDAARPPDRHAPFITNRRRKLALASRPYSFRRMTS